VRYDNWGYTIFPYSQTTINIVVWEDGVSDTKLGKKIEMAIV